METSKIIETLKNNREDFEFYPTTNEILEAMKKELEDRRFESFLDIGCGNGKVLQFIKTHFNPDFLLGIEKSNTLKNLFLNPNDNFLIVGDDFHRTALFDKKVDITFCNPPYKEYKEWTLRILEESLSERIFLVIPQRWRNDDEIKKAIKDRGFAEYIAGSFDFTESEDRVARAKVDLVLFHRRSFDFDSSRVFDGKIEKDFGLEDLFSQLDKASYENERDYEKNLRGDIAGKKDILPARDFMQYLVERYNCSLKELTENLKAIKNISGSFLGDLGVSKEGLCKAIRRKLSFLKNAYWKEAIEKIPEISRKISENQKRDLLRNIVDFGAEFSLENLLSVIVFYAKSSLKRDKQNFIDFWKNLANENNIANYKSNDKAFNEGHRYEYSEKTTKFKGGKLDYRIVFENAGTKYSYDDYLTNVWILSDLCLLARSLGYGINSKLVNREGAITARTDFYKLPFGEHFLYVGGKMIAKIKAFKNANIHIFFDKEILSKINFIVFTELGWVKNKEEAKKEFEDLDSDYIDDYIENKSFFMPKTALLLLQDKGA